MKYFKLLSCLLAFSIFFSFSSSLYSQYIEECCGDEDLLEYWVERTDIQKDKDKLLEQISLLNKEINDLKKISSEKDSELLKAENDLYLAVGSTKSGVAEFRKEFNSLEKIINGQIGKREDAEKRFTVIEASKIKCLSEFWDRYQVMKKNLAAWKAPEVIANTYTVVKGDCLWKISGKEEIYGNPRLWPVLWDANKDGVVSAPTAVPKSIMNPNLIYPGQVLRVPQLSKEEKEKMKNKSSGIRKIRKE
jgi:LysM repeat protein